MVARPLRVRDVLNPVGRARAEVGDAAVPRGGNRRARAVAVGALIAARAIETLDGDLGSMLASALTVHRDLVDAARRSRVAPVLVPIASIGSIPVTASAELTVLVDEIPRVTVEVALGVEFVVADLEVEVHTGWLTALRCRQSVTAELSVETVRVGKGPPLVLERTIAEGSRSTGWAAVPLTAPVLLQTEPAW